MDKIGETDKDFEAVVESLSSRIPFPDNMEAEDYLDFMRRCDKYCINNPWIQWEIKTRGLTVRGRGKAETVSNFSVGRE